MHQALYPREDYFEKVDGFLKKRICTVPFRNGIEASLYAADLVVPLTYLAKLYADIKGVAAFTDQIIVAMQHVIFENYDDLLQELLVMKYLNQEEVSTESREKFKEKISQMLDKAPAIQELSYRFYKLSLIPALLNYLELYVKTPNFIRHSADGRGKHLGTDHVRWHGVPEPYKIMVRDAESGEDREQLIDPSRVVFFYQKLAKTVLQSLAQPFEYSCNLALSGYGKTSSLLTKKMLGGIAKSFYNRAWSNFFISNIGNSCLEYAKQFDFVGTFDENLWFVVCSEACFNAYYFHFNLKKKITQNFIEMFLRQQSGLKAAIYRYKNTVNAMSVVDDPKLKNLKKQEFEAEVNAFIKEHMVEQEPEFLQSYRVDRDQFKGAVNWVLLFGQLLARYYQYIPEVIKTAKELL